MRGRDLILKTGGFKLSLTAQVQALFAAGKVGGMWDLGDTSTLFQDAATPVTAVTQPIGMVLDKRLGLARGPERFSDAEVVFAGESHRVSPGVYRSYSSAGAYNLINLRGNLTVGGWYELQFTIDSVAVVGSGIVLEGVTAQSNTIGFTTVGRKSVIVNASTTYVGLKRSSAACDYQISGVSIRELPGNHATQPTAGSRSLFSARKNLLQKTEVLSDGSWTKQASVTVTDNAVVAPNGSMTGTQVDWTAAAVEAGVFQSGITKPANVPNTKTVYVRADSAGGTVELVDRNHAVGSSLVTLTTSWQPLVLTETTAYTVFGFWVRKTASSPNRIYIAQPQLELSSTSTTYQRVNTASDYDTVGFPAFAQFDATDDALLFPAITFGGAFNTFVAGKVTGGTSGIHLWRTADAGSGFFGVYESASGASPSGLNVGAPTYAINGTALSPSTRGQIYTQANGVDVVLESIGVVLSAETALQFSGYSGFQFQGNAHRVLMISGTLTAGEKLLCRQWCAEGNGVTVV